MNPRERYIELKKIVDTNFAFKPNTYVLPTEPQAYSIEELAKEVKVESCKYMRNLMTVCTKFYIPHTEEQLMDPFNLAGLTTTTLRHTYEEESNVGRLITSYETELPYTWEERSEPLGTLAADIALTIALVGKRLAIEEQGEKIFKILCSSPEKIARNIYENTGNKKGLETIEKHFGIFAKKESNYKTI